MKSISSIIYKFTGCKTVVNNLLVTAFLAFIAGFLIFNLASYSIGIIIALSLAILIIIKPRYYILFWLIIAPIANKIHIPSYGITSYGALNILFLPILITKLIVDCRKESFKIPFLKLYLLFTLVVFASIWYSPYPSIVCIRKWFNFIIPVLLVFLMLGELKKEIVVKKYLRVFLISVTTMSVIGTLMYFFGKWTMILDGIPRAVGVLGHPNSYATFLAMNLAVAISLALISKKKGEKILYSVLGIIIAISVIPTFSKTGYIMIFITFIFVSMMISIKYKKFRYLIKMSFVIAFLGSFALYKYSELIFYRFSSMGSFETRMYLWKSVIHKFFEHPFIGNGFMSSLDMIGRISRVPHLHNLYLTFLLEVGIVGTILFLAFLLSTMFYALKSFFESKNEYVIALSLGFVTLSLLICIASFTGNAFLKPMINFYFWFYFCFFICFSRVEKSQSRYQRTEVRGT